MSSGGVLWPDDHLSLIYLSLWPVATKFSRKKPNTPANALFAGIMIGITGQSDQGIGEILIFNIHATSFDADLVGTREHIGMTATVRRFKFVAREFQKLTERVAKVYRIHEAPVDFAGTGKSRLFEAAHRLIIAGPRDIEREMMEIADAVRVRVAIDLPVLACEDRDQSTISGVEIEVGLLDIVEVGLFENERHAEDALPEIDRRLPVCADERDVMNPLCRDCGFSTRFG